MKFIVGFLLTCFIPLFFYIGNVFSTLTDWQLTKETYLNEGSFFQSVRQDFKDDFEDDGDYRMEEVWPDAKISAFCTTCALVANRAMELNSSETVINIAMQVCINLELGTETVCEGVINENVGEVIYITQNTANLTGKDLCGVAFESKGCKTNNPDRVWEVTFPDVPKPPLFEPPYYPPENVPTYKILHLSDTHHDPHYLPYSNANCEDEYFCCRAESGPVVNEIDEAGFWGDYRKCDLPKWTLESMYQQIKDNNQDIDFIIWTGDLVPHIVWDTSRNSSLEIIRDMCDMLLEYFPGIPVYPALGNHDSDIVDQFAPPLLTDVNFDMKWLYEPLADIWGKWLPIETAETIKYAGYYGTQIKTGLRLFSLNTNYCASRNWWLVMDSNDLGEELQSLVEFLQEAENDNEYVYIIQHHHPDSCFKVWSHQYNLIVSRYETTITGIFFGHAHKDHYRLFFDPEDPERVSEIGYLPGSQTTYSYINPGYRIYTTEAEFYDSKFRVLDHENWYMPLDEANANNISEFKFLYSALKDYQLPDLSPSSWLDFAYQMNEDSSSYFNDFHAHYVKNATPSLFCDDKCKHSLICKLFKTDSSLASPCPF